MSAKTPIRTVFDGSNNATGLAEFQSGEFVALTHGGLGASLSIGSAGQVLKVNSGGSALEFGNVEAVFNIDGMTDGSGITIADGDDFAISDAGTEKKVNASQIKTYVADITLTTAAQTNITSVGTLTSLSVDDITIDGSTISDGGELSVSATGILNLTSAASTGAAIKITPSAGGVLIDSFSLIVLDADNADNGIQYKDGATEMLRIHNSSSDVILHTKVQDKDLIIKGNDGGSDITALTLDMSAAGAATFNDKITLGANKVIEFGDSGETIAGDGTDLTITSSADVTIDAATDITLDAAGEFLFNFGAAGNIAKFSLNTGGLQLTTIGSDADFIVKGNDGGSFITALRLDMSDAGAATFNDKITLGANKVIEFGDSGETITGDGTNLLINSGGYTELTSTGNILLNGASVAIKHSGTNILQIDRVSNAVTITSRVTDDDIKFRGNDGSLTALTLDMSNSGAATFNNNVTVGGDLIVNGTTTTVNSTTVTIDDPIFTLGGDSAPGSDDNKDRGIEFRYHTGSAAKVGFFGYDDSASAFTFIADATNSSEVFSGSAGDVVFGNISIGDSNKVNIGAGNDLQLYHDGSDSFIDDAGTGDLKIRSSFTRIIDMSNSHVAATFASSGVNLRHANSVKLTTTSAGATVTGVLTADGVTLGANESLVLGDAGETISGDGTDLTIASSNDATIDAGGNIILDAATNNILFKDSGVLFGQFANISGQLRILSGSGPAQCLTFDSSGNSTFSNKIIMGADKSIEFGDSGETITGDGTNLTIASSQNLILDTANELKLDSIAGINLLDNGSSYGLLSDSSGDFVIKSQQSDKDIIIKGNDGGSTVTALTLDMSAAGNATFNNNIMIAQDAGATTGKILLGAATDGEQGDLEVYHDGNHSHIRNRSSGDLRLRSGVLKLLSDSSSYLVATLGGSVDLYHDNSKKFETTSTGATVTGALDVTGAPSIGNDEASFGFNAPNAELKAKNSSGSPAANFDIHTTNSSGTTARVLRATHDGILQLMSGDTVVGKLSNSSSDFVIESDVQDKDIVFKGDDGGVSRTALTLDMSDAGTAVFGNNVELSANKDLKFGASTEIIGSDGSDLNISSGNNINLDANGTSINLKDGGTQFGALAKNGNDLRIISSVSDGDMVFRGNDGGSFINAMTIDMSAGGNIGIGTNSPSRDLHVKKSTNGSPVRFEVNNTSNTGASHGVISIYSGGTSGGDPYLHFKVESGEQYSIGIDNDQSDAFVLSNNYGVGSTNLLSIATDGSASFTEKIIMGTNKEVQFVDTNESIKSDGSKLIIKSGGTTFNLPTADGSADQVLATDGSGTLSFADAGGASSGFSESTITTLPGQEGNFDLAKTNNAGSAETGLTSGGTDSFGVALGSVYTMMEPVGASTTNNTDLGSSESHVGA